MLLHFIKSVCGKKKKRYKRIGYEWKGSRGPRNSMIITEGAIHGYALGGIERIVVC